MQVARIIGAAADLSEHTTGVAVQALNATTNLASGATELFLAVASSSLTSGANLWRGIDLNSLHARRCSGQLLVAGDSTLEAWFATPQARQLVPCLEQGLEQQLLAASQSVSLSFPSAQTTTETLNITGWYDAVRIWGSLHGSGKVQLQFDLVRVIFEPRWANPVWQQWQLPLDSEREQIMRLLRQTVVQLPAPPIHSGQAIVEVSSAHAWHLDSEKLLAVVRGLVLSLGQCGSFLTSRVFQSGGLLNFLLVSDEQFDWIGIVWSIFIGIFFLAANWVRNMAHNYEGARPNQGPPPLPLKDMNVTSPEPISGRSLGSYEVVASPRISEASCASLSSSDSVELVSRSQVEEGMAH